MSVCATCGVKRENCKPGGQWYLICPFTGVAHVWTGA